MNILAKKLGLLFLIWVALLSCNAKKTEACQLSIVPDNFQVEAGKVIDFKVERMQTCGRCILPLENTNVTITGGELITDLKWETGRPDVLRFKVKFTQPGSASVTVERVCAKNRNQVVATGNVQAGVPENLQPEQSKESSIVSQTKIVQHIAEKKAAPQEPGSVSVPKVQVNPNPAVSPQPNGVGTTSKTKEELVPTINKTTVGGSETKNALAQFNVITIWVGILVVGLGLFLFKKVWLRRTLLFCSLVGIGFYAGGCPCPVGTIFNLLTNHALPALIIGVIIVVPLLTTLIWGRFFCGWFCPIGAVQEFIYGKNPKQKSVSIAAIDRGLKILKYLLLLLVIYFTWRTGRNVLCQYEPFKALFGFGGDLITLIILVAVLTLSIFIKRPFCRYLCPFGAILALISRFSFYKVKPRADLCVGCRACAKDICPMGAITMGDSDEKLPVINHSECIHCGICTETCFKGALESCFIFNTDKGKKGKSLTG